MVDSHPSAEEGDIGLTLAFSEFLENWPDVELVSITGGEPFHDLTKFREFIDVAAGQNIAVAVLTSGFWAKTYDQALQTLQAVQGLSYISLSVDDFHQKFVPVSFIRNAFEAASLLEIGVQIRLTTHEQMTSSEQVLQQQLLEFCPSASLQLAWLSSHGRGATLDFGRTGPSPEQVFRYGTCPSTGPHMFQDGRVIPCCNTIVSLKSHHPLDFGNAIREGQSGVKEKLMTSDLFLAIKILGFDFLRNGLMALDKSYEKFLPNNSCEFCFSICTDSQLAADIAKVLAPAELKLWLHGIALTNQNNSYSADAIAEAALELQSRRLNRSESAPA